MHSFRFNGTNRKKVPFLVPKYKIAGNRKINVHIIKSGNSLKSWFWRRAIFSSHSMEVLPRLFPSLSFILSITCRWFFRIRGVVRLSLSVLVPSDFVRRVFVCDESIQNFNKIFFVLKKSYQIKKMFRSRCLFLSLSLSVFQFSLTISLSICRSVSHTMMTERISTICHCKGGGA